MNSFLNKKEVEIVNVLMKQHVEQGGTFKIITDRKKGSRSWGLGLNIFDRDGVLINKVPLRTHHLIKTSDGLWFNDFDFFNKDHRDKIMKNTENKDVI